MFPLKGPELKGESGGGGYLGSDWLSCSVQDLSGRGGLIISIVYRSSVRRGRECTSHKICFAVCTFLNVYCVICNTGYKQGIEYMRYRQGIGIKGRAMALVWHEKASRTALQTSSVSHAHRHTT